MDTWPTPELQEAINQGYVIQNVYEVWHFARRSNTMFSSYVDTFLKIKQEASGWPQWVGDDQDKRQQYLDDYQAKEGIALDPDKIDKNPGRRSLAKMMLNSFWGKYGQQGNKSQVQFISSPTKLYELLNDDSRELQTLRDSGKLIRLTESVCSGVIIIYLSCIKSLDISGDFVGCYINTISQLFSYSLSSLAADYSAFRR